MYGLIGALGLAICIATAGFAQDTNSSDGIEDVISSQLEAFRSDDFDTAFTHASPTIKGVFGTSQRFGEMVRQGYPMVHRPADVTFLGRELSGETQRQKVMIRDAAGALHVLRYDMVDVNGRWKIDGVVLIETPEVGA